jgi:hypothetical protein
MNIIAFIGFTVFFILGWMCGQSRWWYTLRQLWAHYMSHDVEEEDD